MDFSTGFPHFSYLDSNTQVSVAIRKENSETK